MPQPEPATERMARQAAITADAFTPTIDATEHHAVAAYLLGYLHGQRDMIRVCKEPPRAR
jgi:hypothetical protein